MVGFQVAPSVSLEHWHHDRKEVMRTDAAEAVAFRKVLTDFRKRLDGLIDSPGGVDLVISGDITASVRSRDPEYAAFTTQRGWGTVGGKTMLVGKRIVVILDGAWLLTVTTAGDPVVNEAQVALADGILVHEAQHVVMHQRESCIDDVKPPEMTGYAGRSLYELGLRVIDEYRAEAAAIPLRNGRREKSNFGVLQAPRVSPSGWQLPTPPTQKIIARSCSRCWAPVNHFGSGWPTSQRRYETQPGQSARYRRHLARAGSGRGMSGTNGSAWPGPWAVRRTHGRTALRNSLKRAPTAWSRSCGGSCSRWVSPSRTGSKALTSSGSGLTSPCERWSSADRRVIGHD